MNCKPGDLALVVCSDYPDTLGRICLVLKTHDVDKEGDWCWLCRFPSPVTWQEEDTFRDEKGRSGMIPDAWLRPIRDPGEDATDETLGWVPSPVWQRAYDEAYGPSVLPSMKEEA